MNDTKINSSYQKDINRLRKRCHELNESIRIRNIYIDQTDRFITYLMDSGKITKEDLIPFFQKKSKTKTKF